MLNFAKHFPKKPNKFEFDAEVSAVFDDMASRSIPGYSEVLDMITSLHMRWPQPDYSQVWDFGCSTGNALLAASQGASNPLIEYYGVDQSEPMLLEAMKKVPFAALFPCDLTNGMPTQLRPGEVGIVIFNWTLQFMRDPSIRRGLIQQAYDSLRPGGFMVVCEKFIYEDKDVQEAAQNSYMWWRRMNGYTIEEIKAKNAALKDSMWPWTHKHLEEAMPEHAFWLYRLYNFGGMVVRKPV